MASHEEIMQKAAAYIQAVQPKLDSYKAQHASFVKGASAAAKTLADQGLIAKEAVDLFVGGVSSDPSSIWGFVEKLAQSFTADSLGSVAPSNIKAASSIDPWEKALFPELHPEYGQVAD